MYRLPILLLSCATVLLGFENPVVDSIPVQGHFTQAGRGVERRHLEKMLMRRSGASRHVDDAKGYRAAAASLGASVWTASLIVSGVQVYSAIKAIEETKFVSTEVQKLTWPVVIGGEFGTFLQTRLNARSRYALRQAVLAHNDDLYGKRERPPKLDYRIARVGNGQWYVQQDVAMNLGTLYYVLREQKASRGNAFRACLYRELSSRTIGVGMAMVVFAIIHSIEKPGNPAKRNTFYGLGSGLTLFAIITSIGSSMTKNEGIKRFNRAVTMPPAPVAPADSDSSSTRQ